MTKHAELGAVILAAVVLLWIWRTVGRRFAGWVLMISIAALLLWNAGYVVAVIIGALVLGVGFLLTVRLKPRVACPICGGSGRFTGWIYTWRFRMCGNCGGNGRVISRVSGAFGSPRIQAQYSREKPQQLGQMGRFKERP